MSDAEKPRARDKRDRKATEETIVAAFEAVLLRDGVPGLGINAVAQEAGVNKVLIYRYFQDLPGLARHWANNSSFWPSELELIGNDPEAFEKLEVRDRVVKVLCNYMASIRARPRTVEMLASELAATNVLTRALAEGLEKSGRGVDEYIKQETADKDISDRVTKMIFVVTALTAFLTVRERNNPAFLNYDLSQNDSWDFLQETVAEIATAYLKD